MEWPLCTSEPVLLLGSKTAGQHITDPENCKSCGTTAGKLNVFYHIGNNENKKLTSFVSFIM